MFRRATAARSSAAPPPSPERRVYVVAHENPGILRLLRPGRGPWRRTAALPPGQAMYQQNCQACHGADRLGFSESGPRSFTRPPIPASNVVAGAPRFDAACDPRRSRDRQGPDAGSSRTSRRATSTISSAFLTSADGLSRSRRGAAFRRSQRRPGWIRRAAVADCRIRIGVDAADRTGGVADAAPRSVSRGLARLHALYDQRVQHGRQPHQTAVHVDREVRLQSARLSSGRFRYGDDPELAARASTV